LSVGTEWKVREHQCVEILAQTRNGSTATYLDSPAVLTPSNAGIAGMTFYNTPDCSPSGSLTTMSTNSSLGSIYAKVSGISTEQVGNISVSAAGLTSATNDIRILPASPSTYGWAMVDNAGSWSSSSPCKKVDYTFYTTQPGGGSSFPGELTSPMSVVVSTPNGTMDLFSSKNDCLTNSASLASLLPATSYTANFGSGSTGQSFYYRPADTTTYVGSVMFLYSSGVPMYTATTWGGPYNP
jgi:hypothetical protein